MTVFCHYASVGLHMDNTNPEAPALVCFQSTSKLLLIIDPRLLIIVKMSKITSLNAEDLRHTIKFDLQSACADWWDRYSPDFTEVTEV